MKAILVLEMPKNCLECPCSDIGKDCFSNDYCELIANKEIESPYEKPDWCPLKPKPEKIRKQIGETEWQQGFTDGWNSFIDEILGDKE